MDLGRAIGSDLRPFFGTRDDPAYRLQARNAWRADSAVDNGSVTTSLPSYLGSSLSLAAHGTGQSIKAISAALGGRYAVSFNGNAAANGYGAVALGGAPTEFSIACVATIAATNTGTCALTDAGAVNTGVSQLMIGTANRGRKVTTDANKTVDPLPKAVVLVTVATSAGVEHWANSYSQTTATLAGALVGTTFHVGCLATAGTFTHSGLWAYAAIWTRALTKGEAGFALRSLGHAYNIAIGS